MFMTQKNAPERKRPGRPLEAFEQRNADRNTNVNQTPQGHEKQRSESYEARSEAAKKGWETRRKNQKKP